jgi:hypothetical protein
MKKIFSLFTLVLLITLFIGCSESDSPSASKPKAEDPTLIVLPADPYTDYLSEEVNTASDADTLATGEVPGDGWKLDQYILAAEPKILNFHDNVAADLRPLFGYRIMASDGYNPFDNKGSADLNWAKISNGYLLNALNEKRSVFPGQDLGNSYRVKNTYAFKIFRKLDVVKADASVVEFETDYLVSETLTWTFSKVGDPVITHTDATVIPLANFISADITATPDQFTYTVRDVTGATLANFTAMTWATVQNSYYVVDDTDPVDEIPYKYEGRVIRTNGATPPDVAGGNLTIKLAASITMTAL